MHLQLKHKRFFAGKFHAAAVRAADAHIEKNLSFSGNCSSLFIHNLVQFRVKTYDTCPALSCSRLNLAKARQSRIRRAEGRIHRIYVYFYHFFCGPAHRRK